MTPQVDPAELFGKIRAACAEVTRRARFVRIDEGGLEVFARELANAPWPEDDLDPAHDFEGEAATQLAFTLLLDAINFGSGWFPVLKKRAGKSGYRTIATACKEHFEQEGSPSAAALRQVDGPWMANMLGQDFGHPEVAELMTLYGEAWREFGDCLGTSHGDRFEGIVEAAEGSAARLVLLLAELPLYRDVSRYEELEVPLYKRAQITAADLHRALPAHPLGQFEDFDQLTLFADNLVPHVLRCHGVLVYEESLALKIDQAVLLDVGSPEEVEIRAVALEAVEQLVAELSRLGKRTTAAELDGMLWNAGQASEIKARRRHRARCSYY